MAASLFTLGLNHHTAPLAVRERVVFHVERMQEALHELKRELAQEAAILSTCNRTEIYCAASSHEIEPTIEWLAHSGGVAPGLGQLTETNFLPAGGAGLSFKPSSKNDIKLRADFAVGKDGSTFYLSLGDAF